MKQHKEDSIRLRHMLDFAQKAVQFTGGHRRVDLDDDEMLALAVVHLIEMIGEAARTISEEVRQSHPEIPWNLIGGTRNRLAHAYIDVDLDIIWTIVTGDLPPLIKELERILKSESGD